VVLALAVAGTAVLGVAHTANLIAVTSWSALPRIAVGLLCGALFADLLTGFVHWGCDTWGSGRGAGFPASLIRNFREHHREPEAMLRGDWLTVNGEAAAAACAGLAILSVPALTRALEARPGLYAAAFSLFSLAGLANQLHAWAHAPQVTKVVRWLQRAGLILSPERHARHHRGAHLTGYCISLGWLNRPLDHIGWWRALEWGIERITGRKPRADAAEEPQWNL
jgi:ubiquitin-conjugating enzyme E2 variant